MAEQLRYNEWPVLESAMVIQQRTELRRNRILYILSVILSLAVIAGAIAQFSVSTSTVQAILALLCVAAVLTIVLSLVQLYSSPKRSHALIIQRDAEMIIATNAVHEGFKLRFLRDVIGENVFSFSDQDREQLKTLEADGYVPALLVRNVRKLLVLRLCTMVFDDVYFVDSSERWDHHDSSSTSEPTFSKREMPPIREWKGLRT